MPAQDEDDANTIQVHTTWDIQRTGRLCLHSFLYTAPVLHLWFNMMEKLFGARLTIVRVVCKISMEQLLVAPLMISGIFASNLILQGGTTEQVLDKIAADLKPTWIRGSITYGIFGLVNYTIIPLKFRVLAANIVSFFWNTYMSGVACTK